MHWVKVRKDTLGVDWVVRMPGGAPTLPLSWISWWTSDPFIVEFDTRSQAKKCVAPNLTHRCYFRVTPPPVFPPPTLPGAAVRQAYMPSDGGPGSTLPGGAR